MDIKQAIAEAKKRWGSKGLAWRRLLAGKATYVVGVTDRGSKELPGLVRGEMRLNYGESEVGFEEAFAEAGQRGKES